MHILHLEHISVWAGHSGAACGPGSPGLIGVSCQSHQGAWDFTFSAGCLDACRAAAAGGEDGVCMSVVGCVPSVKLWAPPVSGTLGHCRHLDEQDKHGSYPWGVYIWVGGEEWRGG